MNFSGYVGHAATFSRMFTIACCLVVGLGLEGVRIRFSVWLMLSCYAHVFMRLWIVIVTLLQRAVQATELVHAGIDFVMCGGKKPM